MAGLTYDTLVIATGPTLADGLTDVLRQADVLVEAQALDCGVAVYRDSDGQLVEVEADPDLPDGVISTSEQPLQLLAWVDTTELERTELAELVAYWPNRDVLVTAGGVHWL